METSAFFVYEEFMIIRPITSADLPQLGQLAQQCFTETFGHLYSPQNLQHHLDTFCSATFFKNELAEGNEILVVEENGLLVGYAKYGHIGVPLKAKPHPNDREIHRLYVLTAHHGKQFGRQLIEAMLAKPQMQQAPAIYISAWSENYKALRFYAHYGFSYFDNYTYYVGDHADDEFILQRKQ
jgi:ribosomal protein S18 acetylase RimI-like enzyme